jgi:hypothetical protein
MTSTYKWITDRSPTEYDVDIKDCIMIPEFRAGLVQEAVSLTLQDYLRNFKEGQRWCHSNRKRKLHSIQTDLSESLTVEQCGSCRFYRNGECRRCPPSPDWGGSWPRTYDNDWCGEWEARQ